MDSATVNAMLAKSNGRDLIMGVAQFLPGVLLPIAEKAGNTELMTTLQSLSTLSGGYRSVTRLSSFYGLVTKGSVPALPQSPEAALKFMSWLCGAMFVPLENEAVLTGHSVLNRGLSAKRKEELGPRCVYFWFWSLVFEQLTHLTNFVKSKKAKDKKGDFVFTKWLQSFCWFLLAWASMPATGTVKLLANPEASLLRPLHALVEATTVSGLALGPFARAACGMGATSLQIMDYFESK